MKLTLSQRGELFDVTESTRITQPDRLNGCKKTEQMNFTLHGVLNSTLILNLAKFVNFLVKSMDELVDPADRATLKPSI